MSIPFTKMQGLGNDFVVIDAIRHPMEFSSEIVRQMADRHLGIGFDQLLVVEPARKSEVDFDFRIFNADGSEVEQCGNGARCVARFLWDSGLTHKEKIILGTQMRNLEVSIEPGYGIAVNMGFPLFEPHEIPFLAEKSADVYTITVDGEQWECGVVNLGNPHAVLIVDDVDSAPVELWGPKLEQHPCFPQRINVGFMQYINKNLARLRVYERGVGETLACGSGACAAMVIGHKRGKLGSEVEMELKGGRLRVRWSPGEAVWMCGPAERVFRGEWLLRS